MKRKFLFLSLLILLVINLACSLPFTIISRDAYIATLVEQTVQKVLEEQLPPASAPSDTPTPPLPAQALSPTFTPLGVVVAPSLNLGSPSSCYQAAFVSETVPDGTTFKPSQSFIKSWRLRNTGSCAWQPDFRLVFYSGDKMGGPGYVLLGKTFQPGQQVDISVNLVSPAKAGTYKGYWRLQANNGVNIFQVYSQIKVSSSTPAPTATKTPFFAVTSVTSNGSNQSPATCAGYVYNFNITITASQPGLVTYRINDSLSGAGTLQSVSFSSAGSKTLAQSIGFSGSGAHTISVYIDSPNHQSFGPFFTVTCPSAFAVTNVELSATQNNPSVTCGEEDTFTTTAVITANGAGVVSYNWEMDTGGAGDWQESPIMTLTFDAAGTKTVQYTWTTTTSSFMDFNYDFYKWLPVPESSYHGMIEGLCN